MGIIFLYSSSFSKKILKFAIKIEVSEMKDPYLIEGTFITEAYVKAAVIAKLTLDENFKRVNESDDLRKKFYWLRDTISLPNFDDLAFCFHNQVFSVLLVADRIEDIDEERYSRFMNNCKEYNLIPSFFIINPVTLKPGFSTWGLCTNHYKRMHPELMITSARIPLSEYEMYAYMITLVANDLKEQGIKINSLNFWPHTDPQIWFYDDKNRLCWLLVRRTTKLKDKDGYKNYINYVRFYPQWERYDGFYAGVYLMPKRYQRNPENTIYRMDDFDIFNNGLQRIYIYD